MSWLTVRARTRKPYPGRTYVYRLYGYDGRLLYVGITNSPSRRFVQHASGDDRKDWWGKVDHRATTLRTYETRNQALRAEEHAIKTEGPVHNKVHNPDWHGTYRGEQPTDRISRPLIMSGVCGALLVGGWNGAWSVTTPLQIMLAIASLSALYVAWLRWSER